MWLSCQLFSASVVRHIFCMFLVVSSLTATHVVFWAWQRCEEFLGLWGIRGLINTGLLSLHWFQDDTRLKTGLRQASAWKPLLEGLLGSWGGGGSEANFLEVCFGRIPCENFYTKATSKKSRPPSGNFRPNPRTSETSPQELFQWGGWSEDGLKIAG